MKIRHILAGLALAIFATATAANADTGCRRYLPATGVTIHVSCTENVTFVTPVPAAKPEQAVVTAKPEPIVSPIVRPTQRAMPVSIQTGSNLKKCVEILERAQAGKILDGDLDTLRNSCRSAR